MTVTVQLCAFSINNFEMFSSWSRDGWTVYASARPSGKLSGWSSFRFPHLSNKNNHVLRFFKPCLKCFLCVFLLFDTHSISFILLFHHVSSLFFIFFWHLSASSRSCCRPLRSALRASRRRTTTTELAAAPGARRPDEQTEPRHRIFKGHIMPYIYNNNNNNDDDDVCNGTLNGLSSALWAVANCLGVRV